jgi:hypothetical protein
MGTVRTRTGFYVCTVLRINFTMDPTYLISKYEYMSLRLEQRWHRRGDGFRFVSIAYI